VGLLGAQRNAQCRGDLFARHAALAERQDLELASREVDWTGGHAVASVRRAGRWDNSNAVVVQPGITFNSVRINISLPRL
jgi:hypothetical protein